MRAAIGGLAAALAACAALSAQAQTPVGAGLKLDDAVTIALAGNKTIAAAKLRRPVGLAGVDVARERPNPDISYEASRETPKQAVGVTFPLELGGKRGARTSAAEAAVATGDAEIEQVIATVLDDVRRTYISLGGAADESPSPKSWSDSSHARVTPHTRGSRRVKCRSVMTWPRKSTFSARRASSWPHAVRSTRRARL